MLREAHFLELLWSEATQPSRNAATLAHNIRIAFRFLETILDSKAKRIIGALVTLNAGPMRTTIWAALFQQLRETHKPSIKVFILKQFANICWAVPPAQAKNAFRTFAHEVRPLLADTQVVVNVTFQRSFSTIMKFFSSFADESLSEELFNILYRNVKEWKQADAVRAAAAAIASLANDIPSTPSPEQLIRNAKYELDCFSLAVLIDTLVSLEESPGRILDQQRVAAFCEEVDAIMATILAGPRKKWKGVPPCVSAYRRLKQIRPSWEPSAGEHFTNFILAALNQVNLSKLLICPLLRFLQKTSCCWSRSSSILWRLTDSADPFVRADAYAALAVTTHTMDAPDQRLVMADLLEKLRLSIDEMCSYTTVAILKFVKTLLPYAHFPPSTEEVYLSKLVHLCRRHGKGLHHDVPAQLELLNVFLCANAAPEALAVFALELFLVSTDRAVAQKAFGVLSRFSMQTFLDSRVQTSGQFIDDVCYFETSIQMGQEEPFEDELLPLIRLHRAEGLTACIYKRLCTLAYTEAKRFASYNIVCDAVKELYAAHTRYDFGSMYFQHTMLCLLSQLLVLEESMPSDAYVSLVQACAACLQGSDVEIREDANLQSTLVQHSWGVIVACATALCPTYAPVPVSPSYRFFRNDSVSQACLNLIYSCRDIALSNEVPLYDSVFHEILSSNTHLFTSCVSLLRDAPIFMAELVESAVSWLECCTTLSPCAPKNVLRLLTALFEVGATAPPLYSQGSKTTRHLLTLMARMCKGIVKQAIEMDLVLCCPEICSFLLLFLSQDKEGEVFSFRELIAGNWQLIGELFSFCERITIYLQNDNDADALAAVLNLLLALCDSVYSPHITSVISRCSLERVFEALRGMHNFAQKRHCLRVISDILTAFDAVDNVEEKMHNCFSQGSAKLDFFDRVDRFVELWNVSNAQVQVRFKAALTCSNNVEKLVCAAAVDVQCIPKAVETALSSSAHREVLDVLLLIVSEAKSETLTPILFAVSDSVFGDNDDLVKAIICSYRWGWYGGPQTIQMLSSEAWRSLNTPLSRYLKQFCGCYENVTTGREFFGAMFLSAPDGCDSPFSFWQSFSGRASAEILQHETEASSLQVRLAEVLQLGSTSAMQFLRSLCERECCLATIFSPSNLRLLASLLASGADFEISLWKPWSLLRLLELFVSTAKDTPVESELSEWLQLSCWLLFDGANRFSGDLESTDAASGRHGKKNSLSAELAAIFVQLSNLFLCTSAKTSEDVARFVVRFAVQNATVFTTGTIVERLFWMVVRHCICEVWAAIAAEAVASMRDADIVAFLCRAHVKVGLPLSVQREVHAFFTPLLLSFGTTESELEEDSLRCVLWLVSSFASRDVSSSVRCGASSLLDVPESADAVGMGERGCDRGAAKRRPVAERIFSRAYAHSFSAAVRHATALLAQRVLSNLADVTPCNVLDALRALGTLAQSSSADANHAVSQLSNSISLEQVYRLALNLTEKFPLLSADASLDPPGHCLSYLLGQLPRERRAYSITDALCLNSVTSLLSNLLQAWLLDSAVGSALPAQLPCVLALYLSYLLRCDLPSYICALQCVRLLSVRGATPEVEAVYEVALPRLTEDLVDARWGAGVDCWWYEVLVECLGHVPGALVDGDRQLARRIWEGLWRGVGSVELNCNQRLIERAQQALRQVIKEVEPKSAQWELCRLILLDSRLQRRHVGLMPVATPAFFVEFNDETFFWLARELQKRAWRLQLFQTQWAFVHDSTVGLDSDSTRSLLFEFEKAIAPVRESPNKRGEFAAGEGAACIVAERVRDSFFSSTDAALAALNHFDFAGIIQRRAVLHELAKTMVRGSQASQASVATTPSWAEVYFDILYERATWHDEGLWVVCALAIVLVGKAELYWSKTVLVSLIPASSSAWKRELMRRIGQRAKISGAQREARQFFAHASERLSALQASPPPWKRELLAAVILVFS
ncbi:hypothetical protein LSCM4_01079 [Leishmania orientalis]|uniref:Uncharacterized protein n=1 Tax=Leishmania orientalis TaxID=2249476 RepID=A0A836KD34_9TRYP|nr:hypothetical protein LSCM4_01079 [Leishmania orientalis]